VVVCRPRAFKRYVLACLICDAYITMTDGVGDAEVALVEKHLRGATPEDDELADVRGGRS